MAKMKELKDYQDVIDQCVKCGCCRAHCPSFGAVKHEGRVARGKIALADSLLKGEVELEEQFLIDMSQCLLCGSCYAHCPNNVPTEDIVAAARREIVKRKGYSSFALGVSSVLARPKMMNVLAKTGGKLSGLIFKKLPENSGMQLRFPAPFITSDRTLPAVTSKPFRERVPELIPGEAGKPRVLFFTGCGINYMYPETGEALIKALKFLGHTIIIPKDQNCCGLPAVSAGSAKTVEHLAAGNRAVFDREDYDVIVTACASCNGGLRNIYPDMIGDEFADMKDKVKDIFVYLVEQGFAEKLDALPKSPEPVTVTYHDPCHLRNHGITKEPRAILKALPQVNYVEMENSDTCCGLGGTYSVYHYDTAKEIGAKKAESIKASGASMVATDCPGCIMQLQDSINHAGEKQKPVHILDLLSDALDSAQ